MLSNKHKDYSATMSNKIYDIEVLEGDTVYIGTEVFAIDEHQAFEIMIIMFGGSINRDSEILSCEERMIQ